MMRESIPVHTLLIHQAFMSKDNPGGTRHFELGKRVVASGQKFTVITSDISYLTGERVVAKKRWLTQSDDDGVKIFRVRAYASVNLSYFHRIIAFLSFMLSSVVAGIRADRPNVLMGTTPPIFQAFSAWLLSAIHRTPFLLEVRDLWPEFAIDIGLLSNPVLIWIARRLEAFLYSRADHLLVNSPAYRDYLVEKGIDPERVTIIPNGVDTQMFDPLDRGEEFRSRFGLRDKFVVTYAGALGMANDLGVVLDAADALRHRPDIQFVLVGDGKERKRLEEQANSRNLSNLIFTGAFPKSRMCEVLAASDACIAILRNIKMFTTPYPNKVFDYMAAGRPTLLAIDGAIRKVMDAAHGGIFVPPGDASELAKAVVQLADNPDMAMKMGSSSREHVVKHFNRDDQAREFSILLRHMAVRESE